MTVQSLNDIEIYYCAIMFNRNSKKNWYTMKVIQNQATINVKIWKLRVLHYW